MPGAHEARKSSFDREKSGRLQLHTVRLAMKNGSHWARGGCGDGGKSPLAAIGRTELAEPDVDEKHKSGGASTVPWIKTNQGVATCLAVVGVGLLIYLANSEWTFQTLRDGFRLGFFTAVSVIAILVCAVAMVFDAQRSESEPEMAAVRGIDWIIAAGTMGLCYLYFTIAWQTEFLLVTPAFMAAAVFLLGFRPWYGAIAAGLVITGVLFVLFRLIGIELPSHVLGL